MSTVQEYNLHEQVEQLHKPSNCAVHTATVIDGEHDEAVNNVDTPTTKESLKTKDGNAKPKSRDFMAVERSNLLTIMKLVIKELIDCSLKRGRMIDGDFPPLQQFFVVLEHALRHGIKARKGLLRERRDFWLVLEQVDKYVADAADITSSVREMPNIRSAIGRARAWLRLALMQKRLADYIRVLVDNKDQIMKEFYDHGSLLLEEEGTILSGLLVGLNVIDFNFSIKDEDLDEAMGVIDFSLYLNDNKLNSTSEDSKESDEQMMTILDQKNYLEELNRHLTATVTNLQQKVESLSTSNTLMKEDLAVCKNNVLQLQHELVQVHSEKELQDHQYKRQLQATTADIETERKTYETSRQGLDSLCQELQKKLREETQTRMEVEHELELQIGLKQEMEVALRLLEKDVHEKQDAMISLRQQLDNIKQLNLEMQTKLKDKEVAVQHKTDLVQRLEDKSTQMAQTIADMERKMKEVLADRQAAQETCHKLSQQLADKDYKRTALETDLKIEREWRTSLQQQLEQEKERLSKVQQELQAYRHLKMEHETLQTRFNQLKQTCDEQEVTLRELGSHLSQSKLEMEDLKEVQQAIKEAQWADDRDVTSCKGCEKLFSVSRRKHHCRNCGDIYCNECSDNKMPLPSSARPVRVCNACKVVLLQK